MSNDAETHSGVTVNAAWEAVLVGWLQNRVRSTSTEWLLDWVEYVIAGQTDYELPLVATPGDLQDEPRAQNQLAKMADLLVQVRKGKYVGRDDCLRDRFVQIDGIYQGALVAELYSHEGIAEAFHSYSQKERDLRLWGQPGQKR